MTEKNGKLDKAALIAAEQELIRVAKDGNVNKMKLLLELELDITKRDKSGYSPFEYLLQADFKKGYEFAMWLNNRTMKRVLQLIRDHECTRDL